jgi:hypothetical protein
MKTDCTDRKLMSELCYRRFSGSTSSGHGFSSADYKLEECGFSR